MATFLNRDKIINGIAGILQNAKKEVVMIVPYIKISENVFRSLKDAEQRGIHVWIVFQEGKLKPDEKDKLTSYANISLLSKPFVHAKCYLNETDMIVCSMNLYDYSERNNNEMGILLSRNAYPKDTMAIEDGLLEVGRVFNASKTEHKASMLGAKSLIPQLLNSPADILQRYCYDVNKLFENKKFREHITPKGGYSILSASYLDEVDAVIDCDFGYYDNFEKHIIPIKVVVLFRYSSERYKELLPALKNFSLAGYYVDVSEKGNAKIRRNSTIQSDWDNLNSLEKTKRYREALTQFMDFVLEKRKLLC